MRYIVAQGREVSINGRRYLGGDELPAIDSATAEALARGLVVTADPVEQPAPKPERRR